jgi:hypothetical protein
MDRHGKWIMAANQTANATVTISSNSYSNTGGGYDITNPNGPTYTYTGTGSGSIGYANTVVSAGVWTSQAVVGTKMTQSGLIELEGGDADIKINGVSLKNTLKAIQERLNILVPNSLLENEWDELKKLGEQYRKLEAELEEKSRMWTALKKTE